MNNVPKDVVIAALTSTSFAIAGAMLAAHPRWLREHDKFCMYFGCVQCNLGLIVLSTGAYMADRVHSFQTFFERLVAMTLFNIPTSCTMEVLVRRSMHL